MAEELLLVNPRRRRRARNAKGRFVKASSRRRNPIATLNPRRRRRRRNPIAALANPRRRRRRRNPIALANPRRRRRRATGYVVGSRRIRRRKMNPRMAFSPRGIMNALIPAGMGAAGAVALDVAMNWVPLPAQFQTPMWKNIARIGGAFALGYVSSFVLGRERAKQVTLGALTVASYTVIRDVVAQNFPQVGLAGADSYDMSDLRMSGVGYISPAARLSGVGAYMRGSMPTPAPGVGAYMRDSLDTVNSMAGVSNDGM